MTKELIKTHTLSKNHIQILLLQQRSQLSKPSQRRPERRKLVIILKQGHSTNAQSIYSYYTLHGHQDLKTIPQTTKPMLVEHGTCNMTILPINLL